MTLNRETGLPQKNKTEYENNAAFFLIQLSVRYSWTDVNILSTTVPLKNVILSIKTEERRYLLFLSPNCFPHSTQILS